MLRLLADENLRVAIVAGLRRRRPEIDFVRVQEVDLGAVDDPTVLAWAAREARFVVTQDVSTMTDFAIARVRDGESMPGLIEIAERLPVGRAIEELLLLAECSHDNEWEGQVIYLPL